MHLDGYELSFGINWFIWWIAGRTLVYDILHDFLFPASKVMMDSMNTSNEEKLEEVNPKSVLFYFFIPI